MKTMLKPKKPKILLKTMLVILKMMVPTCKTSHLKPVSKKSEKLTGIVNLFFFNYNPFSLDVI